MEQNQHHVDPEKIRGMFAKVAAKYDRANTVLSMGIHHQWRKKLVQLSEAAIENRILDCATGTGDLAIEFKKTVGSGGIVIGTDFCSEMMETAPKKAQQKGLPIKFEVADVMNLPYRDQQFDISSISFGIRNVVDPHKALSEMARVTKSGGLVMVLEFGQVKLPVFGPLFDFYSQKILPKIGGWVTGNQDAYSYLQNSSAHFPCRNDFSKIAMSTGKFSSVTWTSLTGGIAYIYKARVL